MTFIQELHFDTDPAKMDKGFFTNINRQPKEGDIEADFSDTRRLHILTDKLRRLTHLLSLNIEVGMRLQDFMRRICKASPPNKSLTPAFGDFDSDLDLFLFQHRTHQARIKSMLQRADGIGSLVGIHQSRLFTISRVCS